MRTAHWECEWIQHLAPRFVKAAMKSGVHCEGLNVGGERR